MLLLQLGQPTEFVLCSHFLGRSRYRAILTSAASKFPLNVVLPPGVAVPAAGAAATPGTSASTPSTTARMPLGADNLAEAASNEYGGAVVVVAASMSVAPLTATPAPVSKPGPPHVKASSNFFPAAGQIGNFDIVVLKITAAAPQTVRFPAPSGQRPHNEYSCSILASPPSILAMTPVLERPPGEFNAKLGSSERSLIF
jgi:hypothetical protein